MDWKELEIDNLPPDILTGDYKVQFLNNNKDWINYTINGIYEIIEELETGVADGIRYRKSEPKQPSHEEIMTLYWRCYDPDFGNCWMKFDLYSKTKGYFFRWDNNSNVEWVNKSFFINKESADIPPES